MPLDGPGSAAARFFPLPPVEGFDNQIGSGRARASEPESDTGAPAGDSPAVTAAYCVAVLAVLLAAIYVGFRL